MENFSEASRLVYKRLTAIDTEQSQALRAESQHPASTLSVH